MQEIIWDVKLDLIIETVIVHGSSFNFSASILILFLLELYRVIKTGKVLWIDIAAN